MVFSNRFQGRTAVVTGGASGIGLAVAARLAQEGAKVSVWDLKEEALGSAKTEAGAADVQALDVSDAGQVARAMAASVAALGGKLDILVASAGITGPNVPVRDYPRRRLAAGDRCQRQRPVLLQPRGGAAHGAQRLRPHRQHRLRRREGRQPECVGLQRVEGRSDRADQVARQGAGKDRDPRQLRHAGGGRRPRFSTRCRSSISTSCCPRFRWAASADRRDRRADLLARSEECSFSTGAVFDASGGRATY